MAAGQPIPPMPEIAKINCTQCQEPLAVRIPKPLCINAPQCTSIVFVHELPDQCPKCGALYIMKVVGFSPGPGSSLVTHLAWTKLKDPASSIIPGNDQTLKATLAVNDLGNT